MKRVWTLRALGCTLLSFTILTFIPLIYFPVYRDITIFYLFCLFIFKLFVLPICRAWKWCGQRCFWFRGFQIYPPSQFSLISFPIYACYVLLPEMISFCVCLLTIISISEFSFCWIWGFWNIRIVFALFFFSTVTSLLTGPCQSVGNSQIRFLCSEPRIRIKNKEIGNLLMN